MSENIVNVIKKEKVDNGGWLLIKVLVIFFSIATILGMIENHHANDPARPKTCPLPPGKYDEKFGPYS